MVGNIQSLLDQREAELQVRIDELRAQLTPAECELEDVRAAKAAIAATAQRRVSQLPANGMGATAASVAYWQGKSPNSQFRNMTMKELVRKALLEEFHDGATARQLLDLFHHNYGRVDIIRSSLSPQLSRLKVEKAIWRDGLVWRLSEPARTSDLLGSIAPNENEPPNGKPEDGSETPDANPDDHQPRTPND